MNAGQLNPTLSVDVQFVVPVDNDSRQTKFGLRENPEVAVWLLSFLDYILCKQGRLEGDIRIAEPPVGTARQRLIAGRIILAEIRPDGGLALRLNPEFEMRLVLNVRLRGEPARSTLLALGDDPDLSRWLLTCHDRNPSEHAPAALSDTLIQSLRRHGALVDELPAEEVFFPDPDAPPDLATDMAGMSGIFPQTAGQGIPAGVRQILGRHTPALPPDTALVWGQDAGTGMVFPGLWPAGDDLLKLDLERSTGMVAAQRVAQWDRQRQVARLALRTRRYAVLREIVPLAQRAKLRHYLRQLVRQGYFPALGDGQVALRSAIHNQSTIASLHHGLAAVVSSICDAPVIASYCYLSCYEQGAVLEKHRDRPQCAYNLSLVLDMDGPNAEPEPWPIYLEIDGQPEAVLLQIGDGLVYSGTELWHWRDALPEGQRAIVCFFHFVPQDFAGSLD